MKATNTLKRRQFLKLSIAGSALAVGGSALSACVPLQRAGMPGGMMPTSAQPQTTVLPLAINSIFKPDLDIDLTATTGQVAVLPGTKTNVFRYEAKVLVGNPNNVTALPDNYLGPVIHAKRGQKVRVRFNNQIPGEPGIVHWHGLVLPERMDGHPRDQIASGQTYIYEFEVKNRAGTYWFHPHTHGLTASQVNKGLAGLFIVSDEEEAALGLPAGERDIPIIIQDRTFDADNQFVYNAISMNDMMSTMQSGGMMSGTQSGGMMAGGMMSGTQSGGMEAGGMMTSMQGMMSSVMGFLGERILVNGKPDAILPVATQAYRLRLLNGSNSRIYKLAWSDGTPLIVIGTDGGLLEKPATRDFIMLGPGERIELWADFAKRKVGDEVTLESLSFESGEVMGAGMMGGMGNMQGMMNGNAPALGAPMTILKVRVANQVQDTLKLPEVLSNLNALRVYEATNAKSPRQFRLTLNGMQWLINGRKFDMEAVADDEIVKLNTTEIWEFLNEKNPGGMMDANGMPHPFHIHGVQFNIIERTVLPDLQSVWNAVRGGFVDEGWKDTFVIMPGERVKVLARFTESGKYVFHCHNLEHENQGMMRNYEVRA